MNRKAPFTARFAIVLWIVLSPSVTLPQESPVDWEVYFSPRGGCTDAIIKELNNARTSVLVQAYSFTSAPIAQSLVDAHKRGLRVEVILDKSQRTDQYSSATFFYNHGVPVKIDAQHAIAHNKIMVIDGATVITGSFNFTKAAEERNAENLLVIHDTRLAGRYTRNWEEHATHSEDYTGKEEIFMEEIFGFVTLDRVGLLLNIIGFLIIVLSFGQHLEEAYPPRRRGREVYPVSIVHPNLFKSGLAIVILGFVLQFLAELR